MSGGRVCKTNGGVVRRRRESRRTRRLSLASSRTPPLHLLVLHPHPPHRPDDDEMHAMLGSLQQPCSSCCCCRPLRSLESQFNPSPRHFIRRTTIFCLNSLRPLQIRRALHVATKLVPLSPKSAIAKNSLPLRRILLGFFSQV